jgi:hypothetical protein
LVNGEKKTTTGLGQTKCIVLLGHSPTQTDREEKSAKNMFAGQSKRTKLDIKGDRKGQAAGDALTSQSCGIVILP